MTDTGTDDADAQPGEISLRDLLAEHLATGTESQRTFARRCGVPQPALSKWLRGHGTLDAAQRQDVKIALYPPDDASGERRSPEEPATEWPRDRLSDVVHALHTGEDPDGLLVRPAPAPVPATLTHAEIHPSPLNPRKTFDADQLTALAESIAERGLLQNLVVRRDGERWVLVAGERRWRAIGLLRDAYRWADNDPIPVRVVDADEIDARLIALLENVQRADVDPLEEARAFAELVDLGVGTEAIAGRIGRSRRHVQLRLQLLRLDDGVAASLAAGEISLAAARAVAHLPPKQQLAFVKRATENQWTGDQLARRARAGWVEADRAAFDVAASGLEVFEEADGTRWILDGKAFAEHQTAEAERRAEAYRAAGWRKVEVVSYFGAYAYLDGRTSDPAAGDVVIEVSWQHVLTEHVGLVPRPDLVRDEPTPEEKAAAAARQAVRARNEERLHAFSDALRAAIAEQPLETLVAIWLHEAAIDGDFRVGLRSVLSYDPNEAVVAALGGSAPTLQQMVSLPRDDLASLLATALLPNARGWLGCNYYAVLDQGRSLAQLLGVPAPELEEVPS